MNDTQARYCFGGYVISVVALMQLYSWYSGHNGAVFALTSAVIGAVSGALLGIKIGNITK